MCFGVPPTKLKSRLFSLAGEDVMDEGLEDNVASQVLYYFNFNFVTSPWSFYSVCNSDIVCPTLLIQIYWWNGRGGHMQTVVVIDNPGCYWSLQHLHTALLYQKRVWGPPFMVCCLYGLLTADLRRPFWSWNQSQFGGVSITQFDRISWHQSHITRRPRHLVAHDVRLIF